MTIRLLLGVVVEVAKVAEQPPVEESKPRKKKGKAVEESVEAPKAAATTKKASKISKKAAKLPTPSPSPEPEPSHLEDQGGSEVENSDEEDVHLHGFSTDEDSSDEDMDGDVDGIDVGKLPTIARDDATVKRKLQKAKRQPVNFFSLIFWANLLNLTAPDRRQRSSQSQSATSRVLREPAEGILRTIRKRHSRAALQEQEGMHNTLSHREIVLYNFFLLRPVARSTMLSLSSILRLSPRSSRRRWTTTSFWATSSSAL